MEVFDILEKDGKEYIVIATEEPGHKLELMPLEMFIINNKEVINNGKVMTIRDVIADERALILQARDTKESQKGKVIMFIISGGRGVGKTRMLLEQASATGGTVVCRDPDAMRDRAHKYGITGLNIIGYSDMDGKRDENVYIHDINSFLTGKFGQVVGYSQQVD